MEQSSKSWIPKIIWTYWETPIQNNDHIKKVFELNRKIMAKDWEIRHINKENMWEWLK
jgi:hypothetical protein